MSNDFVLSATGICKRFHALTVLDGVNFTIRQNEAVGIVGPNGAGKTTFLSVLVGALSPEAGSVIFKGQDVTSMSAADRCRRGLVRTHQIPKPFGGMTVFENVFVAAANGMRFDRDEAYERSIDALRRSALMGVANRRAETLGLLDRKRLELARVLATGPNLLLLDEIGGGLTDAEASELVQIILDLRRRGIAIVWIEHIVHLLLQVTDRLICMDAGRIIADGEPNAVMADQAVIHAYLGGRCVNDILAVDKLDVRHGLLQAVRGVTFSVAKGEIVAFVGANGAGKTTLFRAIAGAHRPADGRISFQGTDITSVPDYERVRRGIALVPEGRRLFSQLSVLENLMLAGAVRRPGRWDLKAVLEVFPNLGGRLDSKAGNLSGGEQQATAIGRALMTNPDIILLDEISLGLSPAAVGRVYDSLQTLIETGTTILLVEQDLNRALSVADRVICMLEGKIAAQGRVQDMTREQITDAYFGLHRATAPGAGT